jgi:hypothetical protein
MPKELFDVIDHHGLNEDTCFLCGASLTDEIRSDEHVFPKWLQHQFGLWNSSLTLLNRTTIPYRQLTIPCCKICNNEHLSALEDRIKRGIFSKNGSPGLPSPQDVFLWTAKILIGIIYRELILPLNRRDPISPPIVDRRAMESFRMLLFFMQSARVPMSFACLETEFPASIFLYDLKCPSEPRLAFDFRDSLIQQTVYMRLGTKGILAAFDGGAQDQVVGDLYRRDGEHVLHPLQFEELGAKLFYKASLCRSIPYYLISEREGHYIVALMSMDDKDALSTGVQYKILDGQTVAFRSTPNPTPTDGSQFDDWLQDDYAKFLATFTGAPIEVINPSPGLVLSWLSNDRNQFTPLGFEQQPYRGVT